MTVDVDGAIVTNCQIEFIGSSFNQTSGNPLTNVGIAGASYNAAVSSPTRHLILPSGADAWQDVSASSDWVQIPSGSAVNNLSAITIEYAFVADLTQPNQWITHVVKGAGTTWELGYDKGSSRFYIYRYASDGTTYRLYYTPAYSLTQGEAYFIQVTWDWSGFTTTPVFKINNVAQTPLTNSSNGTPTVWANDTGMNICVGVSCDSGTPSNDIWAVLRIHSVALSDSDLQTNYNASEWRMGNGGAFTQTVVPDIGVAAVAPTIGLGVTQGTPPNVGVALLMPTIVVESRITVDVDGADITDCIIEYIGDSFPDTTSNYQPVTNAGNGGATYNGTTRLGSHGEYGVGGSGAKRWNFTSADYDWISYPAGELTNNLEELTCEIAFYTDEAFTNGAIVSKCSTSWNTGWSIILEASTGKLMMFRATTDGYIYYETPGSIISQGHAYFVQITWDMSSTSNAPSCVISEDGAAPTTYTYPTTLTKGSSGSSTTWADDSATTGYIGSNYTAYPSNITLYVLRLHNALLSPAQLTVNLEASKWRIAAAPPSTGPYETNCIIKYDFNHSPVANITNSGSAGATYNPTNTGVTATASPNGNAYGYTFDGIDDYITSPGKSSAGALQSNMAGVYTWEFLYAPGTASTQVLWSKSEYTDQTMWTIMIDPNGPLVITRGPYGTARTWLTDPNVPIDFAVGKTYHIFVTWDVSSVSNTPVVTINNIDYSMYEWDSSATSWWDDSAVDVSLGADCCDPTSLYKADGTMYLFRLFTEALSPDHKVQNFMAETWRYKISPVPPLPLQTAATVGQGVDCYLFYYVYGATTSEGDPRLMDPLTLSEVLTTWSVKSGGSTILEYTTTDAEIGYFGDQDDAYYATFYVFVRGADTDALEPGTYALSITITIDGETVTDTSHELVVTPRVAEGWTQTEVPNVGVAVIMPTISTAQFAPVTVDLVTDVTLVGVMSDSVTLYGIEPPKQRGIK